MTWHTLTDPDAADPSSTGRKHWRVAVATDASGRTQVAWPGAQEILEFKEEPAAATHLRAPAPGAPPSTGVKRAGPSTLQAPMAARVLAISAEVGSIVPQGAALVVLEAMKMEHAMAAPHAARIEQLHVEVGEQVTWGQRLVTLGSVSDSDGGTP